MQEFGKTKIYTALQEAGDDLSKEVSDHVFIMCTVLPMPCSLSSGLQWIGKASGAICLQEMEGLQKTIAELTAQAEVLSSSVREKQKGAHSA